MSEHAEIATRAGSSEARVLASYLHDFETTLRDYTSPRPERRDEEGPEVTSAKDLGNQRLAGKIGVLVEMSPRQSNCAPREIRETAASALIPLNV